MLRILAVDDDTAQGLVLAAALHNVAAIDFYSELTAPLEAVGRVEFDAAIIDVHLRRSRENGFDLIRRIQHLDPALAIVLYTGDDSAGVLESALEVRALRRILKGSGKETIIASACACASETRRNRALNLAASIGREAQQQLTEQNETIELTRTVSDLYRGFFHGIANDLTAAGVTGAAFAALAEKLTDTAISPAARAHALADLHLVATTNAETVRRLQSAVRQMTGATNHLTGFENRALVNVALDAVRCIFAADPRLSPADLKCLPAEQELILPVPQLALLNGLRNTGLFLLSTTIGRPSLHFSCSTVNRERAKQLTAHPAPLMILNREHLEQERFVHFHCSCSAAVLETDHLEQELAEPPRAGSLYPLSTLAAILAGTIVFQRTRAGVVVEMLFPVWR